MQENPSAEEDAIQDPIAQMNIGLTYFSGEGKPRDLKTAIKWFAICFAEIIINRFFETTNI